MIIWFPSKVKFTDLLSPLHPLRRSGHLQIWDSSSPVVTSRRYGLMERPIFGDVEKDFEELASYDPRKTINNETGTVILHESVDVD